MQLNSKRHGATDRKSTRLNSSHSQISYAVFCLKKKNAGEIIEADAVAEIENPVCGDIVRLTLRVTAGCTSEIRFKAKGCVTAMACASAMTELVAAKNLAPARRPLRGETD